MEIIVLTVADLDRRYKRKFTVLKAIAKDKISVLAGVKLDIHPGLYAEKHAQISISTKCWVPEFTEIYKDAQCFIRTIQHHGTDRAWAIVFGMISRMTDNNVGKSPADSYQWGKNAYLSDTQPIKLLSAPKLNKLEIKVRELNVKYRDINNAVLITSGSEIDKTMCDIYDEAKKENLNDTISNR